jgi:hypothetical protein
MYENRAHATMIRVIDATGAKRGETVGIKPSVMPTSLQQATLIDAMIGIMISVLTDVTIIEIATAVGPEEVEVIGGIDHH